MYEPHSPNPPDVVAVLDEFRRCLPSNDTVMRLGAATLDVTVNDGRDRTLVFRRDVLLDALRDDSAEDLCGPGMSRVESAARLMSVHREQSLATRDGGISQRWHHVVGGFDPES